MNINLQASPVLSFREKGAIKRIGAIFKGSDDCENAYFERVRRFEAEIKENLELFGFYNFQFCTEEKHLFDSTCISKADAIAHIFEEAETAHAFTSTYHENVCVRDEQQNTFILKAYDQLAEIYAPFEAQAYFEQLEEAA